jgi:hypothetical protein
MVPSLTSQAVKNLLRELSQGMSLMEPQRWIRVPYDGVASRIDLSRNRSNLPLGEQACLKDLRDITLHPSFEFVIVVPAELPQNSSIPVGRADDWGRRDEVLTKGDDLFQIKVAPQKRTISERQVVRWQFRKAF